MSKQTQNTEKFEKLIDIFIEDVGDWYFDKLEYIYRELKNKFLNLNYINNEWNQEDFNNFNKKHWYVASYYEDFVSELQSPPPGNREECLLLIEVIKKRLKAPNVFYKSHKESFYANIYKPEIISLITYNEYLYDLEELKLKLKDKINSSLPIGVILYQYFRWLEKISFKINKYFTMEDIEFSNFSSKEIYLLGENGAGKTILLQNILLKLKGVEYFHEKKITDVAEVIEVIKRENVSYKTYIKKNVLAYGVNRNNISIGLKESFEFMTLFSKDYKLRSPIEWFKNIYNQENEEKADKKKAKPHIKLEDAKKMFSDLLEKNIEILPTATFVSFKEKGEIVEFNQLADGYKSIMIWVTDMISRMSETQPWVKKLKNFKGIVLIDELDLFLHPKWAYKIMGKLRTWFPRIKFIISTHSPVLVLGASEDAIFYKVYKEEGETKVSEPYYFKDYQNLTSNAFLTAPFLFDLDFAGTREMKDKDFYKNKLDTSGHFNIYKINQAVEKRVKEIRKEKNIQLSEKDIEKMINEAIKKAEEEMA